LLEGNAYQLLNQLVGVGIAWCLGIAGTLAILKLVDVTLGCEFQKRKKCRDWISPNTEKRDIIGKRRRRRQAEMLEHSDAATMFKNAEQDLMTL